MSNYTKENLIQIPPTTVPAGTLAMKVGNEIFTPGNIRISSGGSMDFYKCASVNTTSKTWSGYKAVLTDGAYSFDGVATEGLTYGNGLSPVVDGIYDAEALVYVNRLWFGAAAVNEGLVFRMPLAYHTGTADTGQGITYNHDDMTFDVFKNINCVEAHKDGRAITISPSPLGVNTGADLTLSFWVVPRYAYGQDAYLSINHGNGYSSSFGYNGNCSLYCSLNGGSNSVHYGPSLIEYSNNSEWCNVVFVWNGPDTKYVMYLNGEPVISEDVGDPGIPSTEFFMKANPGSRWADIRMYDRALSPEEVALLAANLP